MSLTPVQAKIFNEIFKGLPKIEGECSAEKLDRVISVVESRLGELMYETAEEKYESDLLRVATYCKDASDGINDLNDKILGTQAY